MSRSPRLVAFLVLGVLIALSVLGFILVFSDRVQRSRGDGPSAFEPGHGVSAPASMRVKTPLRFDFHLRLLPRFRATAPELRPIIVEA